MPPKARKVGFVVAFGFFVFQSCPWTADSSSFLFRTNAVQRSTRRRGRNNKSDSFYRLHETNEEKSFLAELRERQQQLEQKTQGIAQKWKRIQECQSSIALVLPDWVRRIAVDYPLIACGSASGEVFIGHLETKTILTSTVRAVKDPPNLTEEESSSISGVDELLLEQTCRFLYGSYDGGGTIAVALRNKLVVDAPRTGGVRLHRLVKDGDGTTVKLLAQGYIPALEGALVTCLDLQPDYLFAGTADGRVLAFSMEDDVPLFLQTKARCEWNLSGNVMSSSTAATSFSGCSPITSLSASSELHCVVATTASSSVEILAVPEEDIDAEDEDESLQVRHELQPVASFYPPFDSTERKAANAFCLKATLAKLPNHTYAIVCGGNDGSLYVQPLNVQARTEALSSPLPLSASIELALTRPLFSLRPFHMGAVQAMVSPAPGLLASAGQDGTLRMYEIGLRTEESRCLYQFAGYKVWVGSLCVADETKLLTDGADNTVIMHDFKGKD